ncbi:general substrate transporter [Gonapodya prolifera JEL478]|uniref:General substrate transporter n=1 Tax=Gonapodya prolifera (strain JEL478) TaxID=1344416 RepID=A0A139ABV8_GONPJ|nr:general substrate transporter [Gonapodya prolifera JEL478]|eukprot:KXS14312.1 general substrate transporter [Gonapodya prolifera JEL478]
MAPALSFKGNLPKLYLYCLIGFVNSATYGFDGSLMSGINSMKQYQNYFGVQSTGVLTGFIFSIYNVGFIVSSFFTGPFADKYGRKAGMATGSAIIIVGSVIGATSTTIAQFMVARFILGCGIAFASAAAPSWVAEISHPSYRGTMTGIYNTFWWVGNILATWTLYPCSFVDSQLAFRLPIALQCLFGVIVCIFVWFLPESPRWLINNGRAEEGLKILVHLHGNDDPKDPIVLREYEEITEAAKQPKASIYDYKPLFADKHNSYRTLLLAATAVFGQMSGNAVVSYFMPQMLEQANITDEHTQLLLNAINSLVCFAAAVTGATLVDRTGRRALLLGCTSAALVCFAVVTGVTATVTSSAGSIVAVTFIYLFGIVFSFGWTPMQVLYPVEVIPYQNRAKGMSLNNLLVNICGFYSSYVTPIAMGSIGWRFYFVYIAWDLMEVIVIYLFFVETKGRTLEELDEVFDAPNPVQASLKPSRALLEEADKPMKA